jgi:hypothetical protein
MAERATLKDRIRRRTTARFHCSGCGQDFRGPRAMNAHHLAKHAGRWTSEQARKVARKMGKEADAARRHARGWLEAAGLRDARGRLTARARSRPELRGRLRTRDLRQAHRHDRDHERAAAHERKADRARTPERQVDRHHRAALLRNRWPELRTPRPAPVRTAPVTRTAPAAGNGSRPRPARTP